MNKGNIIVTGGAGFIGSHISKKLYEIGYNPIIIDNLSTGNRNSVRWGDFYEMPIQNTKKLNQIFEISRPLAVIHLAASAYVDESEKKPLLYYENNLIGMLSLLSVLKKYRKCPIIFSSSCATYGQPVDVPINEKTPQNPINVYGRTKLICEWMLEDFSQAYDIRFISLRYFNVAGADPDGTLAEEHDPETHLIPRALIAAKRGKPPLAIFGSNHSTPDGTCIRDYIHVSDLVDAHIAALNILLSGADNAAFNIGSGLGFSILQIVNEIEAITEKKIPLKKYPRRNGDPAILIADCTKARKELGFKTRYSSLKNIIKTASKHF
jgi:UDP-arabinose 4-epimerase